MDTAETVTTEPLITTDEIMAIATVEGLSAEAAIATTDKIRRSEKRMGTHFDQAWCLLALPSEAFGVVICTEMIEHDDRFWESAKEMARVLRPGGYLILTTRSWRGCPPHEYPSDYWRFLDNGLRSLMEYAGLTCIDAVDCEADGGVFALGRKP